MKYYFAQGPPKLTSIDRANGLAAAAIPPPGLGESRPEVASFPASIRLSTAGQQPSALPLTAWTSVLAAILFYACQKSL